MAWIAFYTENLIVCVRHTCEHPMSFTGYVAAVCVLWSALLWMLLALVLLIQSTPEAYLITPFCVWFSLGRPFGSVITNIVAHTLGWVNCAAREGRAWSLWFSKGVDEPSFLSFSLSNQEKNVSMLMLELGIRGMLMLKLKSLNMWHQTTKIMIQQDKLISYPLFNPHI